MTMLPDGLITGAPAAPTASQNGTQGNPVLQKFMGAMQAIKNSGVEGGSMPAPLMSTPPPAQGLPSAFPTMPRPDETVSDVMPRQTFDDGGVVQSIGDALRPIGDGIRDAIDYVRPTDGAFSRDQYGNTGALTDRQRFASFLLNTAGGANPNFSGAAAWYNGQQKQRLDEMAAERAAGQLMGKFRGAPTFDAQTAVGNINGTPTVTARQVGIQEAQSPAHIRQMNAAAAQAEVGADKVYQAQLAAQQALQKQLMLIQQQEASEYFSSDPAKNAMEANKARAAAHDATNQMVQRILGTPRTGEVPTQSPTPPPAQAAPVNGYTFDRQGNLVPRGQ